MPIGPPRSTSRKMVLFVPRPWYRRCCWHITDRPPSDMPYLHDRVRHHRLPTFNPHGGPITQSSIRSNSDSPVHPLFPKLFLTLGFICNSRATFWGIIDSGIKHNTYTRCLVSGNDDCLSVSNFLWYLLTLLSMCLICSTREILMCSFLGYPQMILPYNILSL